MRAEPFQRIAGVSLALAGLLIAIFWITHPETLADPDGYQRQHLLGLTGTLLLPLGLVGIYGRLTAFKSDWLATAGFLLAFLSSLLAIGISATDAFVWPAIARSQPGLILTAQGVFDQSSTIFTSNYALIGLGLPLVVVGYGLLGVAAWRSGALSRPPILLLVLAAWLSAFAPGFVPHDNLWLKLAVYLPVAAGLVWAGLELWKDKGASR